MMAGQGRGSRLGLRAFEDTAPQVAPRLLGCWLCRRWAPRRLVRYRITEVEAYDSEADGACHARHGRTGRTEVMYGPPGRWYVYLIYGMYDMLNLVCGPLGHPSAVLIRGLEGIPGPGRLTRALAIDRSLNAAPASPQSGLWIEAATDVQEASIETGPRVGIDYAPPFWREIPWRWKLSPSARS